uniref:Uncharacterized protein n=1 Tax=Setaria viridis TaxID=4556 RepID=A0A4V6D984_SETVI|nr:hypothetical protein SEVIR_5G055550v2 [Setaria viridis]
MLLHNEASRYTLAIESLPASIAVQQGCENMGKKVCLLPVDENILIALAFVAVVALMFIAFLQAPPRCRRYF